MQVKAKVRIVFLGSLLLSLLVIIHQQKTSKACLGRVLCSVSLKVVCTIGYKETLKLFGAEGEEVDQGEARLASAVTGGHFPAASDMSEVHPDWAQLAMGSLHVQMEDICMQVSSPMLTPKKGSPLLDFPSPKLCMLPCIVPADAYSDCPALHDAHQPANDSLYGIKSGLHMSSSYPLGHSISIYNTAGLQLESQQGAQRAQHMAQPTCWVPHLKACEQLHELDVYSCNWCLKVSPQFLPKL